LDITLDRTFCQAIFTLDRNFLLPVFGIFCSRNGIAEKIIERLARGLACGLARGLFFPYRLPYVPRLNLRSVSLRLFDLFPFDQFCFLHCRYSLCYVVSGLRLIRFCSDVRYNVNVFRLFQKSPKRGVKKLQAAK
jgi:hypothetical protein